MFSRVSILNKAQLSLYFNFFFIIGLFGDEGILPARLLLEGKTHFLNFFNHPTLQHFSSFLGGDVTCTMDFIAIVGSMIALAG